ncbi:MerR family transcriptional regulator [Vogesella indigofera]|uniref:MerR family transcriptional regulator n=1 Tax=Vogesella indigofera TaxID=45465 RepID=UPI003F43E48C
MLTIGQLARCFGLTTRTLRHYDDIGLLGPGHTGHDNGYRYYQPQHVQRLARIVWLRSLGLSLPEIGSLLHDDAWQDSAQLRQALSRHARHLQSEIDTRQRQLTKLAHFLEHPARSQTTMQTPSLVTRPAFRVIGMQWQQADGGTIAQLWTRFVPRIPEIQNVLSANSYGVCDAHPDGSWRYIAGLEVSADTPVPAGMVAIAIPAQHYAVVEHHGPVQGLPDTFCAAYTEWLPEAGLVAVPGIEFELVDARFLGPDHPDSVVELYIPVNMDATDDDA